MKGHFKSLLIVILIGALFLISAQNAFAVLSSLTETFMDTGYLKYTAAGKGMASWINGWHGPNKTSESIWLDIKGNPVYGVTYWHGYDAPGNQNVQFKRNGNSYQTLYGTELAEVPGGEQGLGFWGEVTSHLATGNNKYTIKDVNFYGWCGIHPPINNGFGTVAVYEDPAQEQWGRLMIYSGNDRAWDGSLYPNGPDTEVLGINLESYDYDRTINITMMFAGGEYTARNPDGRKAPLWYYTASSGTIPTNIIGQAGATQQTPNAIWASDGYQWDTYSFSMTLPAYDSILAFQVESADESFNWINTTVFVPEEVIPEPATMTLFGIGIGALAFKKRFFRKNA